MTEELEIYQQKLAINKFQLDDDIETQAIYFYEIAEKTAQALAERDTLKATFAETEGMLYLEIKHECAENGTKTTETMLHNMVLEAPAYQQANLDLLEAKAYADKWLVLKESFIQRGFMLREMAGLYVAGYFSEFSVKATPETETVQSETKRASISSRRRTTKRPLKKDV